MYIVEFQKCGLPHAHILLWLEQSVMTQSTQLIDDLICAELPDPTKYPLLYEAVTKFMIHGPCEITTLRSPCMQNGDSQNFIQKNLWMKLILMKLGSRFIHYKKMLKF